MPSFYAPRRCCGPVKPVKLVLRGPVVPAQQLAKELRLSLPCRLESSALACMCRPLAKANFEVVVGFRWKSVQMSQISSTRMKELGDALRSIDGYSGATIKLVSNRTQDQLPKGLLQQRRNGVSGLLAVSEDPKAADAAPTAVPVAAPPGSRWVRQKLLISAVFV